MKQHLFDLQKHQAIWRIAWPLMLSNTAVPLLGIVDTAVLGHLDSSWYIGAVAVGGNIFTFIFWAFGFLRMGTTGLSAQYFGAQDWGKSFGILLQACTLALTIALSILFIQGWIFPFLIELIGGSPEVKAASLLYCQIRVWGAPAALLQFALAGWMIGMQQSKALMWVIVSVNTMNILLDVILVVFFGMDIKGVAIATVFSEYLGLVFSIYLIARYTNRNISEGLLKKISFTARRKFLQVNSDIFIRTCLLLFVFAFFTAQGARQGDDVLAANAILISFLLLIANALDGFANAAETKAGENTGQFNRRPYGELIVDFHGNNLVAGFWSAIFSIVLFFGFLLLGPLFIDTLTSLSAVSVIAKEYLIWLIFMPLLTFLSFLLDGVFIGKTKTKEMRNVMIVCLFFVFIPVWYFSQGFGNHGLWLSLSVFMLVRSILMSQRYISISRSAEWFLK